MPTLLAPANTDHARTLFSQIAAMRDEFSGKHPTPYFLAYEWDHAEYTAATEVIHFPYLPENTRVLAMISEITEAVAVTTLSEAGFVTDAPAETVVLNAAALNEALYSYDGIACFQFRQAACRPYIKFVDASAATAGKGILWILVISYNE